MIPNNYPAQFIEGADHDDIETIYFDIYSVKLKEYITFLNANEGLQKIIFR